MINKPNKTKNVIKLAIEANLPIILFLFLWINISANAQELEHPEWGFNDFSANEEYLVTNLSQSAIQQAIDQASENGGGTVLLSGGTVTVDKRINMKSNVKLKGILNADSSHAVTIIAGSRFDEGLIYANSSTKNITVENLILDVDNHHMHGIAYVYGTDNFLINNNTIKNIGTPKINTVSGANDVPSYKDNPTGINVWSNGDFAENFTISNNIIDGVAKHGIDINNGRYFILQNNYIKDAFMGFDASTGSQYGEALGNETVGCSFGAKIIGNNSIDIIIHHNNIHHCDSSPYYWGGEYSYDAGTALVLQGAGSGIKIHDNTLSGVTKEKGIAYWDGGQSGSNVYDNDTTPSDGQPVIADANTFTPSANFSLVHNYPIVIINIFVPKSTNVKLDVFNITGKKIAQLANNQMNTGYHTIYFDVSHLAEGIYIYVLKLKSLKSIKKMIIIR